MTLQDLLDPVIDASFKGFPHSQAPLRRSRIGDQGWNILRGDLPLPVAVLKAEALQHNLNWMQRFATERGLELAPHGKTTLSPQLFARQLAAGAWGMTVANPAQARLALHAGARRCLIANQVFQPIDLQCVAELVAGQPGLRLPFLLDSEAQLELIEAWHGGQPGAGAFEVLLEIGVAGGRTGCRSEAQALALARRAHQSAALRLVGVECYEGLGASGRSEDDTVYAQELMTRVCAIARGCDQLRYFDADEVLVSAGGSAIFDLVALHLRPVLRCRVTGILRSGCYITHDHGQYRRMLSSVALRLGCTETLHAALEVWTAVQSLPEPELAVLTAGKRDISYDLDLPVALSWCRPGGSIPSPAGPDWRVRSLNDQHAYLCWGAAPGPPLAVGDLVALGVSHPCTTFDKWRWMPVVDQNYNVCDAIVTCF